MTPRRTKFYLDKQNAKWSGVCSGIADYTGFDVTLIRVAVFVTTLATFPAGLLVYWLIAWVADSMPRDLYDDPQEAAFWQGVRQSPGRTSRDVRSRFRDMERRMADVETYYTARNTSLAREIDDLR
jgi:phage shock protein C